MWSSSVNDELDEYEEIFVELHDKYKGKAKISPELRLLGGLCGSAVMYHISNKFSSSLPGLDAVLKNNPTLAAQLAEATRNQMNNQQEGAGSFFGGLGGGLGGLGSMFGNMFGGGGSGLGVPPPIPSDMAPQQPGVRQQTQAPKKNMKGPSNIDSILEELNAMSETNGDQDRMDRMEYMSEIAESDIVDDASSINGIFRNKNGRSINLDI